MLKNAINVTGLNRKGRLAGAFRRPDNDCVSRVPFPAQESVRAGFADWFATVADVHRNGGSQAGWAHDVNAPLRRVLDPLGLLWEWNKLPGRSASG